MIVLTIINAVMIQGKKALAEKISALIDSEIRFYANPRNEDAENDLRFCKDKFLKLGLNPTTLDSGLMKEVIEIAVIYKDRCDLSKIICTSTWRSDMDVDLEGDNKPIINGGKVKIIRAA